MENNKESSINNIEAPTKEEKVQLKLQNALEKKQKKKEQKKEFKKWLKEKEEDTGLDVERALFSSKKEPRKALSTFFRNQNKVMVTTLALADRKAMIMIRLNSIIVSIVILLFKYINEEVTMGWLIGIILIIGIGGSLILAILAAKPNQQFLNDIDEKEIVPSYPEFESRNFWISKDVSLQQYEQSMDMVVNSQELQIGNQVRFAYLIEKYLASKYKLLDFAYNIFLVTMVVACITFLVFRVFSEI